ncbi:MAG TPA: alpha/beta fold hydrolase [Anaerolineaceae bacterium]|nr:alpha/beta fold hydrolase [Anaerolineaceae bacterium]
MTPQTGSPQLFQHPELDGSSFFWPAGQAGVLLLHGFTATTVEVRPLATLLRERGYSLSAPLLPGHGTTPEDLNRCRWRDWTAAAEEAFSALGTHCQSIVVAGESMGGLLALHLAARHPDIRGLLLYAPAIRIQRIWLSILAAPFISIRPKAYTSGEDPACYPWQGYTVLPVRAVAQLYQLQRHIHRLLPAVKQPVRIFQGLQDHTIDPHGAQEICDQIGSSAKQLVWLPDSGHTVLLDRDFHQIAAESLEFIQQISDEGSQQVRFPLNRMGL